MADNIRKVDLVDIELNRGNIHRSFLNHTIGMMDDNGDAFGVSLYRNGIPIDLTGTVVQGYFQNPQGTVIAVTNNIVSGNKAMVILPKSCYEHEGQFSLTIKVTGGAITGTMRIVDGTVSNINAADSVAPESLFGWNSAYEGWCWMWNVTTQDVERLEGAQWGQSAPIPVKPGQRIMISNVTPGNDAYSVIRLGSNDITDTLTGVVAIPAAYGEESIYIYEVPADTYWITTGYVTTLRDRIYIGPVHSEREGDTGGVNLFNLNGYYTGWLYQPAQGGGVEKTIGEAFAQTNVMHVAPGDLINIYGATPNADNFFVTIHGSDDIDDPISSALITPMKAVDRYSLANYTVPAGVSFISFAIIAANAGVVDIYVGEKNERRARTAVNFLGDSITQGFIAPNVWANPTYPVIVGNRLNCEANNYGVAATGICNGSSESFVARLNRMGESWIDCLVIFGGTNDYGDGLAKTLGSMADAPAQGTNFYASYKYLIETAMNKYPMAQILVITPMRRQYSGPNEYGISMEDIVTAEKTIAGYYGVACFDFYHEGGINPAITNQRNQYAPDGLHPNQLGINEFLGPRISEAVERLIKYRG